MNQPMQTQVLHKDMAAIQLTALPALVATWHNETKHSAQQAASHCR